MYPFNDVPEKRTPYMQILIEYLFTNGSVFATKQEAKKIVSALIECEVPFTANNTKHGTVCIAV